MGKKKFLQTTEQKIAKSIDRHIAITANAGSGKTTVLVDRYLRLITDKSNGRTPVSPRDISAITFTKLAASEMMERVVKKLNEKITESETEKEMMELTKIRSQLSGAKILTIHSFCARILREFPIEAGISPNFKELTGADQLIMQRQAISQAIEDNIFGLPTPGSNANPNQDDLKKLIFALGSINQLEEYLMTILNRRIIFDKIIDFYQKDTDEYLENTNQKLKEIVILNLRTIRIEFLRISQNGVFVGQKKHSPHSVLDTLERIDEILNSLKTCSESGLQTFLTEKFRELDALLRKLYITSKYELTKAMERIVADPGIVSEINYALKELNETKSKVDALSLNDSQLYYSKTLISIGQKAIQYYADEKAANECLDFDDLMIKTKELLYSDNPKILDSLRSKIKFLMVDEFQDTDSLQYDIIKKLVKDLDDDTAMYDNNIFIVGDPKQSIYGFRGADVSVFGTAKKDIYYSNKSRYDNSEISNNFQCVNEVIQSSDNNQIFGNITLPATFRTMPDIAFFVNKVCNYSFGNNNRKNEDDSYDDQENNFAVDYDDLIPAKNAKDFCDYLDNNIDTDEKISEDDFAKIKGNVELLIYYKTRKDPRADSEISENEKKYSELDLVADYIMKKVRDEGHKFGEFAVLSRTTAPLGDLGIKLIERKIPFVSHSGGGFFNIPEILDIISLLKFITSPDEDIAFLTVLKSSFCGFDNTDLYILSQQEGASYFNKLQTVIEKYASNSIPNNINSMLGQIDPNAKNINLFTDQLERIYNQKDFAIRIEKYQHVYEILNELISNKMDLNPAIMLTKAFEMFNWYHVIKNSPYAPRIKANTEKLLQMSREYVRQGFKNIYDFVQEIDFQSKNEVGEPEAAVISDIDQVNLMTIHASKGLEFKNVIILGAAETLQKAGRESLYIDEEFGINFTFNHPETEGSVIYGAKSSFFLMSRDFAKLKSKEEEKRVMYVAMTRAIENLVILCVPKSSKSEDGYSVTNNSLASYISMAFDYKYYTDSSQRSAYFTESESKPVKLLVERNQAFEIVEKDYALTFKTTTYIPSVHYSDDLKLINDKSNQNNTINNINAYSQVLKSSISGEFVSATRMMKFANDEKAYTRRFILGFPEKLMDFSEDDEISQEFTENNTDFLSPLEFGIATHYVFEKLNDWFKNGDINQDALEKVLNVAVRMLSISDTNKAREDINNIAQRVAKSGIFKSYSNNLPDSRSEVNLYYPTNDDFIQGIIDFLIQDNNGNYEIWDWKTNRINDNLEEIAESYKDQMQLYAYFLYKLYPDQTEFKSKLVFVRQLLTNPSLANNIDKWTYTFIWNKQELDEYEKGLSERIKSITSYPFINNKFD